ncbi:hypothetical protein NQ318_009795 [Aromia moschata]|uniref:Origin recognition complex subunit 2 n=1 Tax=Aromia moschata TaxID=1265417 RepID=A0AAV8Y7X5_9CUCU|nr:hypothetical protein NQ318_009795 [Aromia moschata]
MASGSSPLIRKTTRQKKPSLKALESLYISKLKHSGFVRQSSSDDDNNFTDEDDYQDVEIEKPKLLHSNDIVHGDEIFKFHTQKRQGLARKVAEVCNENTPYIERRKAKTKIEKLLQDADSSGSDNTEESDSEVEIPKPARSKGKFSKTKLQPTASRGRSKYNILQTAPQKKICTSNNTLDKLETPRLPQYQLQKLLQDTKLSQEHERALKSLSEINTGFFSKWVFLLNENFNILVYGLGSKRNILNQFHTEYLKDSPVIVVNGFFPTLSIKSILDGIIVDLLELEENPANINEAAELIIQEFNSMPKTHLYLIVHNIEGEILRNSKTQNILAKLSATKNIHLLASIDHINAPLIWDHKKLNKFNYIWWDVTSFSPYTVENSFELSLMVQQSGSLALSSLRNVFVSLTSNSKRIYTIIVKHQLQNAKNQYYQGLAFKDLYMACREAFIVSSDLALRAQLAEFTDHKMVKMKRSVDGTEYLIIPLAKDLLQKFLEENA